MQLPFFPAETKMINSQIGVKLSEEMVYYFNYTSPIYCHMESDENGFKYMLANLVVSKLCKAKELSDFFGISRRNIDRYSKSLREKGIGYFFTENGERKSFPHVLKESVLIEVQKLLDGGASVNGIANQIGVSEGAIRYHIKQNNLKKKV